MSRCSLNDCVLYFSCSRTHSVDIYTQYRSPSWDYPPNRAQSFNQLFDQTYGTQPPFYSVKQDQTNPRYKTYYQVFPTDQPYRSARRDKVKTRYPLLCTYQVPIKARNRTCNHGTLSTGSPVRSNQALRSTSSSRNRSPACRFRRSRSSGAPWASSAPSIIAVLDEPSPGRETLSRQPAYPCRHDGAEWEDCRIVIHCFGLGAGNFRVGRAHLGSDHAPPTSRTGTYRKRSDSPRSPRNLTYQRHQTGDRKPRLLRARSVRLSIVPLNPIYRRKLYNPNCTNCSVRRSLSPRTFDRSSLPVFWCKRLIQRMVS